MRFPTYRVMKFLVITFSMLVSASGSAAPVDLAEKSVVGHVTGKSTMGTTSPTALQANVMIPPVNPEFGYIVHSMSFHYESTLGLFTISHGAIAYSELRGPYDWCQQPVRHLLGQLIMSVGSTRERVCLCCEFSRFSYDTATIIA